MLKHTSRVGSCQTNTSSVVGEDFQNPYYTMENAACSRSEIDWKRIVPKLLIGAGCLLLVLTMIVIAWRWTSSDEEKNNETDDEVRNVYFGNYTKDSDFAQRLKFQRSFYKGYFGEKNNPKVIVILSPLDDNDIGRCFETPSSLMKQMCDFTFDTSRIAEADAVVVREKDFFAGNFPKRNNSKQLWIYNSLMPNTNKTAIGEDFSKIFNVTGTYDIRSHLPMILMYWVTGSKNPEPKGYIKETVTDEEQVRVVVYNKDCTEENVFQEKYQREIKELEEGGDVVIEWYGNCNQSKNWKDDCVNMTSAQCYATVATKAKFALSFELFDVDYISERFFDPLNNTILPLVLDKGLLWKYRLVAPENSFVNVSSDTIPQLKTLLKTLNTDESRLKEYFVWAMENPQKGEWKPYLRWYCQVCATLHRAVNITSTIADINLWR